MKRIRTVTAAIAALASAALLGGCEKVSSALKDALESADAEATVDGGEWVRDLEASEFDEFINTPNTVVVIDYHAEWCGPCKQLGPVLEKVVAEFEGEVLLGKVDVDQAGDLPMQQGVRSIPDVRIYRGGRSVQRFTGTRPESEIRSLLEGEVAQLSYGESVSGGEEGGEPAIQPMSRDWVPPGVQKR